MHNYFGAISLEHSDDGTFDNGSDYKTTDSQKSPFIITSFEWHTFQKKNQKQKRGNDEGSGIKSTDDNNEKLDCF